MTGDTLWRSLRAHFHKFTGMTLPVHSAANAVEILGELATRTGASSAADLLAKAARSPGSPERLALIERLSIGASWFMREKAGLLELCAAVERIAATRPRREVRVWCAGVSTGQEAYSIAVLLLERGLNPCILASDINAAALEKTRLGIYPQSAAESLPEELRARYFTPVGGGRVQASAALRRRISVLEHNFALEPCPPEGHSRFDAVVCRNALIYFEVDDAVKVSRRLLDACAPAGYVLFGAVERPLLEMAAGLRDEGHGVARVTPPRSTTRSTDRTGSIPTLPRPTPAPTPSSATGSYPAIAVPSSTARSSSPNLTPPPSVAPRRPMGGNPLERAVEMWREERVPAALVALDEAIAADRLSCPAHLLRGLILKRQGRLDEAVRSLRTARFLAREAWLPPYELGVCLEKQGERDDAAEAFRHALEALGAGGSSGLPASMADHDVLAETVRQTCTLRLGGAGPLTKK